MIRRNHIDGLTLVEMLVAIMITGILSLGIAGLLSTCLQAERFGNTKSDMMLDGNFTMERMIRKTQLGYSASVVSSDLVLVTYEPYTDNDDAHYYLADRLFPKPNPNSATTWTYHYDSGLGVLQETAVTSATSQTSNLIQNVTAFTPSLTAADATQDSQVQINLTLNDGAGIVLSWSETVFPANSTQKYGRRIQ